MSTAIRAQRRAAILEAAELEFRERGFERAKMEEIARRAGIGKSTIYEYFPSKTDLLTEVLSEAMIRMNSMLREFFQRPEPLRHKLEALLGRSGRMMSQAFMPLIAMQDCQPAFDFLREHGTAERDLIMDLLCSTVEKAMQKGEVRGDLNPRFIAGITFSLIVSAGNGLFMQMEPPEDYVRHTVTLLFEGIAPRRV